MGYEFAGVFEFFLKILTIKKSRFAVGNIKRMIL